MSTSRGHLCSPIPQSETVSCGHCGEVESNLRHICEPKVSNLKYSCGTCGRTAVKENQLCSPEKIKPAKDKKADKGCCCG